MTSGIRRSAPSRAAIAVVVAALALSTLSVVADVPARASNHFAPGGVSGSSLWVKADDGLQVNGSNQVEQWLDQSSSGNTTTELRAAHPAHTDAIAASNDIVMVPGAINFNPTVDFTGASGKSLKGNGTAEWDVTPVTVFGVSVIEGVPGTNIAGVWNANVRWGGSTGSAAGVGLLSSGTYYALDGNGCIRALTTAPVNVPRVARAVYATGSNTLGGSTWLDGAQQATGTSCGSTAATFFEVGGRTGGGGAVDARIFNGKIAEVVVFRNAVSAADSQRIESYLATKYGVTLGSSAAPINYVASDGTTVYWQNPGFHNDVAGIGRDEDSELNQKQSASINGTNIVTVGHGAIAATNAENPNDFTTDLSFLMWGHDNAAVDAWVDTGATTAPLVNYQRVPRTWRAQETGAVGDTTISFNVGNAAADVPDAISGYYLLRDANGDGDLTDETPIPLTDDGGGRFSASGIDFSDGERFTIATLAADYGVEVRVVDNLTSEDGDTGLFQVRLTAPPTAPVTIALSSSDTDEGTVPASVTVQPGDWDDFDANPVVVQGVDDAPPVGDGAVEYSILTGDVTSTDAGFDGLTGDDVLDVVMFNQNNDPPGINAEVVGPNATTEAGACVAVQFELLSQPAAAVTVPLSVSDPAEGSLGAVTEITITPANWDQPQNNVVDVCGVDDAAIDGDILYSLVTGDPTSSDTAYEALTADQVADIALVNVDDDAPPPDLDADDDSIPDAVEQAAPNGGDANDDGTPDFTQRHVASFENAVSGDYAVLEVDAACQIVAVGVATEAGQAVADPEFDYPAGLMNFTADCGTPGATIPVSLSFFGVDDEDSVGRKHNPNTNAYFTIDGGTVERLVIGGEALTRASFEITDGGELDLNGATDGTIVDPAGLGVDVTGGGDPPGPAPPPGVTGPTTPAAPVVASPNFTG